VGREGELQQIKEFVDANHPKRGKVRATNLVVLLYGCLSFFTLPSFCSLLLSAASHAAPVPLILIQDIPLSVNRRLLGVWYLVLPSTQLLVLALSQAFSSHVGGGVVGWRRMARWLNLRSGIQIFTSKST
jgi:hypothetical protein